MHRNSRQTHAVEEKWLNRQHIGNVYDFTALSGMGLVSPILKDLRIRDSAT